MIMATDDILFIYIMIVLGASSYCAVMCRDCTVKTFAKIALFPIVLLIVGIKECVKLIKE